MIAVGNTPLIKLRHLTDGEMADVYVKWEGANPTGSMKDRMALSMIRGAEDRGELGPGGRVVEYTGGSTGSSLAMVCATRGYRAHFVSSDGFAEEKLQTMRAFGAEVEIVPAPDRVLTAGVIDRMIARARVLAAAPGTFWPDQVNNPDNRRGYHPMAQEILDQLSAHGGAASGGVTEFICAVGGGGCISGNAEVLKVLTEHPDQFKPATRRALQAKLRDNAFYAGALDGDFGPGTRRGLRAAYGVTEN